MFGIFLFEIKILLFEFLEHFTVSNCKATESEISILDILAPKYVWRATLKVSETLFDPRSRVSWCQCSKVLFTCQFGFYNYHK